MKRLLVSAATICAALFGLISVSRAYGSLNPLEGVTWFTMPDGSECPKVCLFGLQPGMPFDEALNLLRTHPATQPLMQSPREVNDLMHFRGAEFEVLIGRDPDLMQLAWVTAIRKNFHNAPLLLLQDATARYGPPTYVFARPGSILVDFFFMGNSLQITTIHNAIPSNQYLNLDSTVHSISLRDLDQFKDVVLRQNAGLQTWRGYTCVTRYYPGYYRSNRLKFRP